MNTPALEIGGVAKSYGPVKVLDGIDLTLRGGEIVALLGRSGCGKTTLLRLVAGFERADAGTIEMGGRRLDAPAAWVPPHRRGIGYVPQEGALFPHLSAAGNIGFGLAAGHGRSGTIAALLDLIGMSDLGARMPHELSGGQQQRVALARALAPAPAIVLLDEPFNALDAHLRRTLCGDVRRILKDSGTAAILVTHDRDEAFSVADEIAVMREGRLIQRGTPAALYAHPVDLATAGIVGTALCLPADLTGASAATALGLLGVRNPGLVPDGSAIAMLRPEQVLPAADGTGFPVTVRHVAVLGPLTWLDLTPASGTFAPSLTACWLAAAPPPAGTRIEIRIEGSAVLYPVTGVPITDAPGSEKSARPRRD